MVGNGIAACKVAIPEKYLEVYQNLLNEGDIKIKARKKIREEQNDFVAGMLEHSTNTLTASNEDNGGEDDNDSSKDDEAMTLGGNVLGISMCERSWGDVKHIKGGKRSHLG